MSLCFLSDGANIYPGLSNWPTVSNGSTACVFFVAMYHCVSCMAVRSLENNSGRQAGTTSFFPLLNLNLAVPLGNPASRKHQPGRRATAYQ